MSAVFAAAVQRWKQLRMQFEDLRIAAYVRALEECNGQLLNARGVKAGVDAFDLFIGNDARAYAYASPELINHWLVYPRPKFSDFERQMLEVHE
ncbi:hypothetical protein [Gryllotalpicola koreensis]|uniref:Uncharacterized protein n=1 Tax=Gryllotalpicola koreensis TaxID=993086 RepID=A0ABP8A6W1_9MICO